MTFLVCYTVTSVAAALIGALHEAIGGYGPPFAALGCLGGVALAIATGFRPELGGAAR
jgi:hypothetical protein